MWENDTNPSILHFVINCGETVVFVSTVTFRETPCSKLWPFMFVVLSLCFWFGYSVFSFFIVTVQGIVQGFSKFNVQRFSGTQRNQSCSTSLKLFFLPTLLMWLFFFWCDIIIIKSKYSDSTLLNDRLRYCIYNKVEIDTTNECICGSGKTKDDVSASAASLPCVWQTKMAHMATTSTGRDWAAWQCWQAEVTCFIF